MEALILLAAVLAVAFFAMQGRPRKKSRRVWRQPYEPAARNLPKSGEPEWSSAPADAIESEEPDDLARERSHLRAAEHGRYFRQPLLHEDEARLFREIQDALHSDNRFRRKVRLMAQVSMGEMLRTQAPQEWMRTRSYRAINSKRVDMLVTCYHFHPRVVIEYQGAHHQNDPATMLRDQAKKIALDKAGIAMVEIRPGEAQADYMPRIEAALRQTYSKLFNQGSIW